MVDKRKIVIIVLECLMAVEGILVLELYDVSPGEIICNRIKNVGGTNYER